MQDNERVQSRLENVRAVEPLLSAMRTISMGNWQMARKRIGDVREHRARLTSVLRLLLPHLPKARRSRSAPAESAGRVVLLVIGSERGLVGQFNRTVAERAVRCRQEHGARGLQVDIWALGTRLIRILERQQPPLAYARELPVVSLPPYRLALDLTRRLLREYEGHKLLRAEVLYQRYESGTRYRLAHLRLVPPELNLDASNGTAESWPPPIVETEPLGLYARLVEQLTATILYSCFVESGAAEHAARYHLMEEATQNAEQLIDELTLSIQIARRQSITREMQELVAGAGLLR